MGVETLAWGEEEHYSHVEGPTNPADPDGRPADGTKVGIPDMRKESLDTPDSNNKNPLLKPPTLEEMTLQRKVSDRKIAAAAKQNPDWPPAKGNPKKEGELNEKLNEGMSLA